jgi:hypothetical protein
MIIAGSVPMQSILAVHDVEGRRRSYPDASERRGFPLASPKDAGPHGEKHVTA